MNYKSESGTGQNKRERIRKEKRFNGFSFSGKFLLDSGLEFEGKCFRSNLVKIHLKEEKKRYRFESEKIDEDIRFLEIINLTTYFINNKS